jgi:hypothetical protein
MGMFSHQGCCEHQVQVADVRLLHKAGRQLQCLIIIIMLPTQPAVQCAC